MSSRREIPFTIRQATHEDVGSILDLLTDYGLPRSSFEPFYLNDSSYHPGQSWVVEQSGRLVSHVRVYDRWIRVGRATLHIAGIGNVITALDARGHGYAGKIMQAMLPVLQREEYAYSLLWTHLPELYGRYGWIPIEQELVRAAPSLSPLGSISIVPFRDEDLPEIMSIYDANNATRTGTAVRTLEYWRELPTWLHEDRDGLLVAHDKTNEVIAGYVRNRATQEAVEILEIGIRENNFAVGRTLLTAASAKHHGRLQGQFPPSLRILFCPHEFGIEPEQGLMGRVIALPPVISALGPLWLDRVREAGKSEFTLTLATSAGRAMIQVRDGNIQVADSSGTGSAPSLNEREFAHLLFHGFDERAQRHMGNRPDVPCLQVLFPPQDFVIWQADAF